MLSTDGTYIRIHRPVEQIYTKRQGSNMNTDTLMTISNEAIDRIIEIRDQEPDDDDYALFIEITGLQGTQFGYSLAFIPIAETDSDAHVEHHRDLTVVIPSADTANMNGASLIISAGMAGSLAIENPNNPASPVLPEPSGDLSGSVAEKVTQVLDQQVNPGIAAHGGHARLVSEDNGVVYLEMGGGCQGCGMAAATLRQGIERILRDSIPEITEIVDVTDHMSGANPYYT